MREFKVLLIEDESAVADFIESILTAAEGVKFTVSRARRVRGAEKLLKSESFDCIVTDLWLPNGEGTDTLTRIATAAKSIPVIVATGMEFEGKSLAVLQQHCFRLFFKLDLARNPREFLYAVEIAIHRRNMPGWFRRSVVVVGDAFIWLVKRIIG